MASFNKVILMGNLTRDPELRYTPKGTAIARLGVAVNRRWTSENGEQREETSPVQLFPHHFDLAMSWYSGQQVPEQDAADEESSDEQMTFGFVTGDEVISDPYFYATAYPEPDGFVGSPLPDGAVWSEVGFSGAVLPYAALERVDQPHQLIAKFLRQAHEAGASQMTG